MRRLPPTRADEGGTSLVAAGWTREATVRGRGWHSARRVRSNSNGWIDKIRWSRTLPGRSRRERTPKPEQTQPGTRDCLHEVLFAGVAFAAVQLGAAVGKCR